MKNLKKYLFLLICLSLIPSFIVKAENEKLNKFHVEVKDTVTSNYDVFGSSIIAGGNVTSKNTVEGIDMLFGNNINYGSTSDYAFVAGNSISMNGAVKNDGFVLGNLITFTENFTSNRDVIILGNSVTLKGKFDRDVTIYAASVIVENTVIEGDLKIYSQNLKIEDSTVIKGELSYNKDIESDISEGAEIGKVTLMDSIIKEITVKERVWNFIVNFGGVLLVFLALAVIVPSLFKRIENKNKDITLLNAFSMLGFGALTLILVPILFIFLIMLFIGVQLALLLLILYILVIWLSIIFSGYLLGYVIWKNFVKKEENTLLIGLIGISIISILTVIPYISGFASVISLMIGVGVVLQLLKKD